MCKDLIVKKKKEINVIHRVYVRRDETNDIICFFDIIFTDKQTFIQLFIRI